MPLLIMNGDLKIEKSFSEKFSHLCGWENDLSKGHLSIFSIEWCGAIHPRR
jgi:hypothetical protein